MHKFIDNIVAFSLKNKFFIFFCTVIAVIAGAVSFKHTPIDAFPDVTNTKVTIITQWAGRSAEEVEKFITIPIEIAMNPVQKKTDIRSTTLFGLSVINVMFEDRVDDFTARQQVYNLLNDADLPEGVTPEVQPLYGPTGEIYRYTLRSDRRSVRDLKTIQDWVIERNLRSVSGVADIVSKYGLVPKDVMPETNSSENTSRMAGLIALKLREQGLQLRDLAAQGAKPAALEKTKTEMLSTIYRMLVLNLGVPPTEFTWTEYNAKGEPVSTETYTPLSFLKKYGDEKLIDNYVMLMNDPSREYYKCYEIDYDRHRYDGKNWTYVNLPIEDIKEMAISSLKDSTMMYFSCDVGKFLNSDRGLLDVKNYDYESLMGTSFGMNKKQRIQSFASGSSHAMTLMAVDLDKNGKPTKWMVENSWGPAAGYQGYLIMTDDWFNEYMFRLVVETKYASKKALEVLKQKPIRLPAWDPMFAE